MIAVTQINTLLLQSGSQESAFISAASGLSWVGNYLYIVADDALHLGVFKTPVTAPGTMLTLLEGELPQEHKARKAAKPDFEVLTHWREFPGAPGGALVALGSGSKKNRCLCVIVPLNSDGSIAGNVEVFDFGALYAHLDTIIPALNIEGAVFTADELWLFQRGNSAEGKNAIIRLPQALFTQMLKKPDDILTPHLQGEKICIQEIVLGTHYGVPLGFTDATRLDDGRILFSAAAEATEDTYNDGRCAGSVIGLLSEEANVLWQKPIDQGCKVEGIATYIHDNKIECLLVTDADDANVPALILRAVIDYQP